MKIKGVLVSTKENSKTVQGFDNYLLRGTWDYFQRILIFPILTH